MAKKFGKGKGIMNRYLLPLFIFGPFGKHMQQSFRQITCEIIPAE
jgi:hypothetical protein